MIDQFTPFMLLNLLVFTLTTGLAGYALYLYVYRTRRPLLLALSGFMLSISGWECTEFLKFASSSARFKLLMENVENAVPAALFLYFLLWFTLEYTDNQQWIHPWVSGGAVLTVIGLSLAVYINPEFLYHSRGLTTQGPWRMFGVTIEEWFILDRTINPPFRAYQLFAYGVHFLGGGIIIQYILQSKSQLYVGQAIALLMGFIPQLTFNGAIFIGLLDPQWNVTAILFGFTALGFAIAVFNYRLLDFVPVGRHELFDLVNDPVILIDQNNDVVDANSAARDLVNAGSLWQGTPLAEFLQPISCDIEDILNPTSDTEIDVQEGNETKIFQPKTSTLRIRDGQRSGLLIMLSDISILKQRERQLETSNQELKRANEKLERFNRMVSHDLKNPLSVATGRLDLVQENYDGPHVDQLERALTRISSIIHDLLKLARNRESESRQQQIDLGDLSKSCWKTMQTRQATLNTNQAPTITGDPSQLRQLLSNLFDNAVRHGGNDVTVRIGAAPSGFYVEDDGKGIPPGRRDEVMDSGVTSRDNGTGFGLDIVREIARDHGWKTSVDGNPEGGTRITFTAREKKPEEKTYK